MKGKNWGKIFIKFINTDQTKQTLSIKDKSE
jgi:hypothetical protein